MNLSQIPLSLYIHIPWCIKKCPYCDFNSYRIKGDIPEAEYVQRLIGDLEQSKNPCDTRELSTIFFGGGTPSLFKAESIAKILAVVADNYRLSSKIEISLEANPATVERDQFVNYKKAGINRISLGCQSFDDTKLKAIGRIHTAKDSAACLTELNRANIDNFNIDLMYGLPGQSLADAIADLKYAIQAQPQHISWYNLTLEPNTEFYARPPKLPSDDTIWEMMVAGSKLLTANGYIQYETSNFAKLQCKHNLNYWQYGDYIAVGAGAHGKITKARTNSITRIVKQRNPKRYLDSNTPFILSKKLLTVNDIIFEFFLNNLRLHSPLPLSRWEMMTNLSSSILQPYLDKARSKGFINLDQDTISCTNLGRRFLNDLITIFLP